ncbi:MAG: DUF1501 domain-containing protein [Aliishimia sp.]
MSSPDLTRRRFMTRAGLLGCSVAASPLMTPISFAAAPWDTRLVVIILRGGMDGLDAVQPYGDPAWGNLRRKLAGGPENGSLDLDGFYALHPALAPLKPMWDSGQLGFVHAVSTPYRDKRSHFDGQDVLEAGTTDLSAGARDGWLNRMLQDMPGVTGETAYAIGRGEMYLMKGKAPVAEWTPGSDLTLSPQAQKLMELVMEEDPAMHAAFAEAEALTGESAVQQMMQGVRSKQKQVKGKVKGHVRIAKFAAKKLRQEARVAAFSLNGWDTHQHQLRAFEPALGRLSDVLLTLKQDLTGPIWNKTAVIAMTEFGRTARENGTAGTDHGTGGLMVFAGGAIKGGKVLGTWPGLDTSDLYEGRDLMPTRDVRAHAAWMMRGLTGLDRAKLEAAIFPGLDMGRDPGLLL